MASTNVEEYGDLELLVIVQNNDRGEVYQTASFDLSSDNVANEQAEQLPGVVLYPNPARDYAILSGLNNATVQIFDLTGRMVYEVAGADAMIELPVEGFNAGSYIIRISQDGKTAVRRLNVVR